MMPDEQTATHLRTVLVTGCSSGIGRAIALLLAENGYRVLAGVRSEQNADEIAAFGLPELSPVLLDVTKDEDVERVVQHIESVSPSGLYALINNAGLALPAVLELSSLDELRLLLEVNTVGPLRMIQACLPMLRKGRGRVINMSSMNGTLALPMVGAYSASKFALEALSDTLRVELRPWQIPVSIVRPGQIPTAIFSKARDAMNERSGKIPESLRGGYEPIFARTLKFNKRGAKSKTTPEAVARVVLRALQAKRPRTHYHVGADVFGLRALRALTPTWLLDRLLARAVGAIKPVD